MTNPTADAKKKCVWLNVYPYTHSVPCDSIPNRLRRARARSLSIALSLYVSVCMSCGVGRPVVLTLYVDIVYLSEGNDAFKQQDYPTAVAKYSEAIDLDPLNHVYYSNRRSVDAVAKTTTKKGMRCR